MKTSFLGYLCLLALALPVAAAQEAPAPAAAQTTPAGTNPAAPAASLTASAVWLPGKPWALEWASEGFTTRDNEIQPDGSRYFLAENEKTRLMISISLTVSQPAAQPPAQTG